MATIRADYHTHTVYSHGLGTIEENVKAAEGAGLALVGIADHGPGHKGFGISMENLPQMRKDIEAAALRHPAVRVLLGVEANIINESGKLDVDAGDLHKFDYIIAGYHYGVFGEAPAKACLVHAGGFLYSLFGSSTAAVRNRNTELVLRALQSNPVRIISHPGDKAAFDIDAIARCCEKTGTWLEINDHHRCLTVEGIRTAAKYNVSFVLGSDAHRPCNVGCVDRALERVREAGLDTARIVNYGR